LRQQVQATDPVPPSRLNKDMTAHLDGFCLRCLRKNPWRRYYRAYDVLTRLRLFQDDPLGRGMPPERRPKRLPPEMGETPDR
jgi:hypothetical protein